MKRIGIALLVLAPAMAGCVELPTRTETKGPPAAASTPLVPVESAAVTPDQVNDDNAPKVLNALRDELDRAANENTATPKP